jgi:hypothetical protein
MKIENFRLYSHIELKLMDQISIYKKFQLHILEFSEVQDNKDVRENNETKNPNYVPFCIKGRDI